VIGMPEQQSFRCLSTAGFGDPQNSYAFSMAWFGDGLFVGTVRNMLALVAASPPPDPAQMQPWPVTIPDDVFDLDLRAQIWRQGSPDEKWKRAYTSPMLGGRDREPAPRDLGYRSMTVFQGDGDSEPALYVATASSNSRGTGAHVLRYSSDGSVRTTGTPGLGDGRVSTLRTLVGMDDRIYTSPTGSGRAWNAADCPAVHVSEDPMSGRWRTVSEPGFSDPDNEALYAMTPFAGHLYVGTLNAAEGYQVWKGRRTRTGMVWHQVVDGGAGRGPLNEAAMTMCVFGGSLYIGSGISNGGFDRTYGVGPAAGEVIRIHTDDTWELVVGASRRTERGRVFPTSRLGPGFDNPCTGYVWSMAVHDGRLYVGTFDSTIFGLWANPRSRERWGVEGAPDLLVAERAGAELWSTSDGDDWSPVTTSGFGNPYNYGIRTLASTPHGLYAGTANPFGPEVAVRFAGGWQYVPNPRGGAEVWLVGQDSPGGSAPMRHRPGPTSLVQAPARSGVPTAVGRQSARRLRERPVAQALDALPEDMLRRFYRGTEYWGCGWWEPGTEDAVEAVEELLDELVEALPPRTRSVLDLSAAALGSTPYLATSLAGAAVEGVVDSVAELRRSRGGQSAGFLVADPFDLEPNGQGVDAVVALQGLPAERRAEWYAVAHRQLRPGGHLAVADLVLGGPVNEYSRGTLPVRYRSLLLEKGFRQIEVENVTDSTWLPFLEQLGAHLRWEARTGRLAASQARRLRAGLDSLRPHGCLLLVSARRV
jgi:SAM-dependent methyltransferase